MNQIKRQERKKEKKNEDACLEPCMTGTAEKSGSQWVVANKESVQDSLKYWKKAKCLITCDMINLKIFRKKTQRWQPFNFNYWLSFGKILEVNDLKSNDYDPGGDVGLSNLDNHMATEWAMCELVYLHYLTESLQ